MTLTLTPRGPFSLAASIRFLEGFTPARYAGGGPSVLRLAFPLDGRWTPVGLRVRQDADGVVHAQARSPGDPPDRDAVRAQLRRILSLDVDGSGFAEVGERDPVVGGLQRRYPGLRPVTFWSPYEAACWAVISHRIRITQAATVKARLTERLGTPVELPDGGVTAFPGPVELLRGAGAPDVVPWHEQRLRQAVRDAYRLDGDVDDDTLTRITDGWRPYRTWISLLLRTWREDETGEISGRRRRG
ncbi:hypothetical protein EV384_4462 [Micromonospora kangleipakensis]|uniref:DNA-3-methyladenine glycosylase 2 family protein n=2 Tax=Micromonospora kangleipakensis TaxID=1077942 RepID=A0A4Q8BDC3_9ACTN|nr:hypothetical protein EV384_4462 [Micromonospora kangleipakensis]